MAHFEIYLPQLLRFEGGYVDDPHDPGGATNKGITLAVFKAQAPALLGVQGDLHELACLDDVQAGRLYKALYWDPVQGDAIASQGLAEIVFDFHVNAGPHAIALLQRLLGPPLSADGRFGPSTGAALLRADPAALYPRYRQGRIDYYRALAAEHPVLRRFLSGWLARAEWFPPQARA